MRMLITAATILISASALAAEPKIHRDLDYANPLTPTGGSMSTPQPMAQTIR